MQQGGTRVRNFVGGQWLNAERALSLAHHFQFGTVWINDHLPLVAEMAWTGMRQSGYGRVMSTYAFQDYTQLKHVMAKLD